MAKLIQNRVIEHRGGMRPGGPDPVHVRPPAAPADKGGVPIRRQVNGSAADVTRDASDATPESSS